MKRATMAAQQRAGILEVLALAQDWETTRRLADRTWWSVPTVHRHLRQLAAEGLVERAPGRRHDRWRMR